LRNCASSCAAANRGSFIRAGALAFLFAAGAMLHVSELEPSGLIGRYMPEWSVSLKDLSVGLILQTMVSVNATGEGAWQASNRKRPDNVPKNSRYKKTRQSVSDVPGSFVL